MSINVLHVFGRMDRGGAEMRTLELMPLMKKKEVQFNFCTLRDGPGLLDKDIRKLDGAIYPCPLQPGLNSFGGRFIKLLRRTRPHIVHSHVHFTSGYLVRLAAKAGIPVRLVHFRNTTDGKKLTFDRKLWRDLRLHWAHKYATGVLAVCRGAMEFGWGKQWQSDPRCEILYNGLDITPYQKQGNEREQLLHELSIPPYSLLVINVARFRRQKGHDILLQAAEQVLRLDRHYHFILVGDGDLREDMQDMAERLGIQKQVHFLGIRSDVPRLLMSADCFVLPSRWEGLPGVVLEAAAAGLPIIATDLPGVREIAEHVPQVRIIPAEDVNALADALSDMKTSPAKHSNHNCFPEEFRLDFCAEKLYKFYQHQLNG